MVKPSRFDKGFNIVNNIIMACLLIATLYPLIYVASSSFSSPTAVMTGQVKLLPVEFGFKGYVACFKNGSIFTGYKNTIYYTLVGTFLNVSFTLLAAFPLSRRELVGRNGLSFMLAFTMWFNGGMIPNYLLMKSLGAINTPWAMWLPGLVGAWNVIITRTFIQTTIPDEIFESASLDGCNYFTYFWKIVIPLSGAIIAVIGLFSAVAHWNSYFNAFLYISKPELQPLQIVLRNILLQNQMSGETFVEMTNDAAEAGLQELLKYSLIMVSCVPIWCVYPFVQRFFITGVMVGSVKG